MNNTDTRTPEEIERDILATQEEMSQTVNKIGNQMTPKNIFNALLDKADENGVDARYLLDGARRNPLALGLISAGAIWLVSDYDATPRAFKSSKTSTNDTGDDWSRGVDSYDTDYDTGSYDTDHKSYIEYMSRFSRNPDEDDHSYQCRRDEYRGTYLMIERDHGEDHKSYRQRLDEATEKMRQKRSNFADGAKRRGRQMTDTGRNAARRTGEVYQEQPLLGGLAAALVGAIIGSTMPVTRMEREKLGQHGANVLDQAGAKARELGDKALEKKDDLIEVADRKISEAAPQTDNSGQGGQDQMAQVSSPTMSTGY